MSVAKRNSPPRLEDARQPLEAVVLDEAPLPVPPLRPRIGIEQVDARERARRQPVDECAGVAEMQADIAEPVGVDGGERLGDGVEEGVAADEAAARIGLGLIDQVLGAAEADFQPHIVDRRRKQARAGRRAPALRDRARCAAAACRTARPAAASAHDPCAGRRRRVGLIVAVPLTHACHRPRRLAIR